MESAGQERYPRTGGALTPKDAGRMSPAIDDLAQTFKRISIATDALERLGDRLLGSRPTGVSNSVAQPDPSASLDKLDQVAGWLRNAAERLQSEASRLETL